MTKQVIVIRKDLNMRKGKMCAQAAHASMSFLTRNINGGGNIILSYEQLEWLEESFKKVVVSVNSEEELLTLHVAALQAGLTSHLVTDSGATEFAGIPTHTCIAIGPHHDGCFAALTDSLPLL